jgi:hypothetical protein
MKTNEIPSGTSTIAPKMMRLTINVTGASAVRLPPSSLGSATRKGHAAGARDELGQEPAGAS